MAQLIGTAANQVPVNGMLGTAAFVDVEQLTFSPAQASALALKAPIDSPAFTGIPSLGAWTTSGDSLVVGFITIKDSGGTLRKLAVIG